MMNLFSDKNFYLNFCQGIVNNDNFQDEYKLIYKIGVLCDLFFIVNDEFNIKQNIQQELNKEIKKLDSSTIKRLLESAFIFANLNIDEYSLTNEEKEKYILEIDNIKNRAYRIAISVYYYGKYIKNFSNNTSFFENNNIIYQLFTRLGILTKSRNEIIENTDIFSLNFSLKIEAVHKELANKFSVGEMFEKEKLQNIFENFSHFQGDEVYFSDFQKQIINGLIGYRNQNGQYVGKSQIISAPTSAGKTFIIKKYIIFKIIESFIFNKNINIAFIVPSKALINEIKADFVKIFQDYFIKEDDKVSIHTNLSKDDYLDKFYNKSNLFIFTPERLNYFYNDIKFGGKGNLKIDILIIDEAHKVGYGYRGTLLQFIGKQIQKENSGVQIILLAPLLKKLHKFQKEFLLENVKIEENFSYFTPVAKNEIFVEINRKKGMKYNIKYFIKIDSQKILLFKQEYIVEKFLYNEDGAKTFKMLQEKSLATISRFFTGKCNQSIIFRYGVEQTKTQIELIQKGIKNNFLKNIEIGNYISEILPKSFNIEGLIKSGLAYHNGHLPISIKTLIEELFKDRKLQFLVANHTILEGVNLPAKNIFVHTGDYFGKTLNYFDKKNLIGRTGRLNEHLSGNIFYVNFKDTHVEEILSEEGLEELEFNISNILDNENVDENTKTTKFDRYLQYIKLGDDDSWKKVHKYSGRLIKEQILYQELKDFEYMTGYLISCKLDNPRFEFSKKIKGFINERGEEQGFKFEKLDNYLNTIYNDVISRQDMEFQKILQKNIFIDPRKQMHFYDEIRNGENEFIIEKIGEYSEIIKILVDTTIIGREIIKYGDKEYEKNISSKIMKLKALMENMQEYFILKFQYTSNKESYPEYYYGNNKYSGENTVLPILSQWLHSIPIKKIIETSSLDKFFDRLKIITNQIQFEYVNALTVYFELANLGYKKYIEEREGLDYNDEKFDENFIYYMELGSFYPNFVYLISKGVSRESVILMGNKNIIEKFPPNKNSNLYFKENREIILKNLKTYQLDFIIKELDTFIYNS